MRSLSTDSMKSELKDSAKINEVSQKVDTLETYVNQNTSDIAENTSNISDLSEKVDNLSDSVTTGTLTANKANATAVNANTIKAVTETITGSSTIEHIISPSANITNLISGTETADTLNATKGNIAQLNVSGKATIGEIDVDTYNIDTLTSEDITFTDKVSGPKIEVGEISTGTLSAGGSISAKSASIDETLTTKNETVSNTLDANFVNVGNTLDVSMIKWNKHTMTLPSQTTNYSIIAIPEFHSGEYRIQGVDSTGVTFSFTAKNDYGNINFSYSRNTSTALQEVRISNNAIFVKTATVGTLYYFYNGNEDVSGPLIYDDWTTSADYSYVAYASIANVYTKVVSNYYVDTEGQKPLGSGTLDIAATDNVEDIENESQYNTQADITAHTYKPDQNLNTTSDVTFNTVQNQAETTESLTVGTGSNAGDAGQYLRETASGASLQYESPATVSDGALTNEDRLISASGLSGWNGSVKTTDSEGTETTSYPITKVGTITEGRWEGGNVVASAIRATSNLYATKDLSVGGNATITGDLTVKGKTITTHEEELVVDDDTITLRHDATTAIATGECSGIEINNYDGNGTTLQVAVDSEGTLRVGTDIGTSGGNNEPFLTRSETSDLTGDHLLKWDSTNNKAVDSGKTVADLTSNITTYTSYSQLGLTSKPTTVNLYAAMPMWSIFVGQGADNISDLPYTSAVGCIIILKCGRPRAIWSKKMQGEQDYEMCAVSDNTALSGTWTVMGKDLRNAGLILYGTGDISETTAFAQSAGTLSIGTPTGTHLEMDGNEIFPKTNGTTLGSVYIHGTWSMNQPTTDHFCIPKKTAAQATADREIFILNS